MTPPPMPRRKAGFFHASTGTQPQDRRPHARPATSTDRSRTTSTASSPGHSAHRARTQGRQPQQPTGPAKGKPPPHLDHPQPIRRQRPRSTRPEAIFLHPSPVATGTDRRHQPPKNAISARSAIPRQITSAHFAPVTGPFLCLLRCPSRRQIPSPRAHLPATCAHPRRSSPAPGRSAQIPRTPFDRQDRNNF